MSIVEKLTEGVINRDLSRESNALLDKWERTGLLEGLESDYSRQAMASLLENQAKELLREASTMAQGDVEGFAAVAFPIVRRVFGGLVANELVSVQPMSLPSGLIFFLDFTTTNLKLGSEPCESVYGGGKVGSQITGGVSLTGDSAEDSFYNLNNGYASPTASFSVPATTAGAVNSDQGAIVVAYGTYGGGQPVWGNNGNTNTPGTAALTGLSTQLDFDRLCRFDADFTSGTTNVAIVRVTGSGAWPGQFNRDDLVTFTARTLDGSALAATYGTQARRLTTYSGSLSGLHQPSDGQGSDILIFFHSDTLAATALSGTIAGSAMAFDMAISDNFNAGSSIGSVVGAPTWDLEALGTDSCGTTNSASAIAEIDIKVDSIAITANTKKLRAKWTPELQQDINAYHNLDAEVELTSILSETIALEIDQEILEDLIVGATAGTMYWSRLPGKFLNKNTGANINSTLFPDFTGTVSEWYETLLERVNDVSAQIHRKTLRGGANFLVTSPEIANVLEFTSGFRASTTADENKGTAGAVNVGSISKKWDVYVDPYFPRNLILVGRKGNSFLESGYVYAPYVPLQTTPTIFDPENFTPRKGVMTRYGKKMVRPDMYGLVIVQDLV